MKMPKSSVIKIDGKHTVIHVFVSVASRSPPPQPRIFISFMKILHSSTLGDDERISLHAIYREDLVLSLCIYRLKNHQRANDEHRL